MTLAEALIEEMAARGFPPPGDRASFADVARAMQLRNRGSERVRNWCTKDMLPDTEEYMEAVARFLHLGSVYDLGPLYIASYLKREENRRQARLRHQR